jgi:hypothetical protein
MKVYCKKCKMELTGELTPLPGEGMLSDIDKKSCIPVGYYYASKGEVYTDSNGQILVNLGDLVNVKNHTDPSRLNGCCGLDGTDGLNKTCGNGHEVGTEHSDCWMPWAMAFEPTKVFLK